MIQAVVRRLESIRPVVWRWIFVIYYLALTTGTHWPSLRIGRPGPIPVDKILHVIAFCGAAGFLMLTRWCERSAPRAFTHRNIHRSAIIMLIAAALDELSQNLPGQDRFATWEDFVANAAGVIIATLVARALFAPAEPAKPKVA